MEKLQLLMAVMLFGVANSAISMEPEEPRETANQYLRDRDISVYLGEIANTTNRKINITLGYEGEYVATIPAGETVDVDYRISNFNLKQYSDDVIKATIRQHLLTRGWIAADVRANTLGYVYPEITFKKGVLSQIRATVELETANLPCLVTYGRRTASIWDEISSPAKQSGSYIISINFGDNLESTSIKATCKP